MNLVVEYFSTKITATLFVVWSLHKWLRNWCTIASLNLMPSSWFVAPGLKKIIG